MYGLGSDDIKFRSYWTFVKKQGFTGNFLIIWITVCLWKLNYVAGFSVKFILNMNKLRTEDVVESDILKWDDSRINNLEEKC